MSDTQILLGKIAALRQQLEEVQSLARDKPPDPPERGEAGERVWRLQRQVAAGELHNILLDSTLRHLTPPGSNGVAPALPKQLTARARRILEQGRSLIERLRDVASQLELMGPSSSEREQGGCTQPEDPLTVCHEETFAMVDAAMRMITNFPDSPSIQLRLCDGVEAILGVATERADRLAAAASSQGEESGRIEALASLLRRLSEGRPVQVEEAAGMAEALLAEVQAAAPLRFPIAGVDDPARFTARHSLTVARVMARVVRHDPELRGQPLAPVLAALLHDVGMLKVPLALLQKIEPFEATERRTLEAHTYIGAEILTRYLPSAGWLADTAQGHHERLDGTGYPGGLRDSKISPLTRLLSVCDVYAALCSPRPHRAALDTRTALADTLLLAEQGTLDRFHAERLLLLSFYPVGSVVELADGAVGVVVATHMGRRELNTPARPVLALLTNSQQGVLSPPLHVDLAQCEGRSIVRTLAPDERRRILGRRYPELV